MNDDTEYEPASVTAMRMIWGVMKIAVIAVVLLFAARWAYSEWYVSTHCTMVLGTQVCRQ